MECCGGAAPTGLGCRQWFKELLQDRRPGSGSLYLTKGRCRMDLTTKVRIAAGIIFVILVVIIVMRRKKMASKRRPLP